MRTSSTTSPPARLSGSTICSSRTCRSTGCAASTRSRVVDLDSAWRLHPQVALRQEPFGALAYHFGNRRLSFLKTRKLVAVVQALDEHRSLRTALESASVTREEEAAYVSALEQLASGE